MTDTSLRERADRRFEQALAEAGVPDPRNAYRGWLRQLREQSSEGYQRAVGYYEKRLLPAVAAEGSDPIQEWIEYGRLLAEQISPGRTVQIDPTGRERPHAAPVAADHLVLHLPASTREPAQVVWLPRDLSFAQRAACDLLVAGSQG
ncbi:MAG TPA: hypothetical protein VGR27_04650 [Longimicrobiaceae bacterium]|nr:hypothetical protein [Longimicrobiaceae bacterium]